MFLAAERERERAEGEGERNGNGKRVMRAVISCHGRNDTSIASSLVRHTRATSSEKEASRKAGRRNPGRPALCAVCLDLRLLCHNHQALQCKHGIFVILLVPDCTANVVGCPPQYFTDATSQSSHSVGCPQTLGKLQYKFLKELK